MYCQYELQCNVHEERTDDVRTWSRSAAISGTLREIPNDADGSEQSMCISICICILLHYHCLCHCHISICRDRDNCLNSTTTTYSTDDEYMTSMYRIKTAIVIIYVKWMAHLTTEKYTSLHDCCDR